MASNKKPGFLWILFGKKRSRQLDYSVTHDPDEEKEFTDQNNFTYPYKVNNRFLTTAEHSFYLVAQKVLGDSVSVCPQAPLSAVFNVTDRQASYTAFNRIARKRVDFIVCDAVTMKILFGIELDDSSHERAERIVRDDFVNRVFEAASLPLVHINTRQAYNTNELKSLFAQALGLKTEETSPFLPEVGVREIQPEPEPPQNYEVCPTCGAPFSVRKSIAGPNVGRRFYVCSRYPKCKTSILIE
jgi:hypothetical protein